MMPFGFASTKDVIHEIPSIDSIDSIETHVEVRTAMSNRNANEGKRGIREMRIMIITTVFQIRRFIKTLEY